MNSTPYTEDTLVQQTTAEYLEQQLGWESVYAYNSEDFGPDSLLGRTSDREVVLTRHLHAALRSESRPTRRRLQRRDPTNHIHHRFAEHRRHQPRKVRPHPRWRTRHIPQRQRRSGRGNASESSILTPPKTTISSAYANCG